MPAFARQPLCCSRITVKCCIVAPRGSRHSVVANESSPPKVVQRQHSFSPTTPERDFDGTSKHLRIKPSATTMADKDSAAKVRIIKHLNADHQESLSLYLRHYAALSSSAAHTPTMTDITFTEMTFHTRDGKTCTVPFDPPMKNWGEARMRTVEMDRESRAALGLSSIRITEYELPHGVWQWSVIGLIAVASAVFANLRSIVPGTFIYDNLLPWWPGGPEWFFPFVSILPQAVFGIHLVEALWLAHAKLRKHNVRMGSPLWWKWFASCVVEGGGTIIRINAIVARKQAEVETKQH